MFLQVCLEEEASLKGLPTLFTDERPSLTVARLLVNAQGICTVGTVFALITLVWLYPCVERQSDTKRGLMIGFASPHP